MTVGEKIQTHRKQLGMSQEELGQKLLVSRQTISLWEKDQTVPTIDNLMRLREIFNVLVDDILFGKEEEQSVELIPEEEYSVEFTPLEVIEIYTLQRKPFYLRMLFFIILFAVIIVLDLKEDIHPFVAGFVTAMAFLGVFLCAKAISANKTAFKNNAEQICRTTYEYKVFKDYLKINTYRGGEQVRELKCYFKEIQRINTLGKWLIFSYSGQSFFVVKKDLVENSAFYLCENEIKLKSKRKDVTGKKRVLSILLFIFSLTSIFIALWLTAIIFQQNGKFTENLWTFFAVLPIPVSSVVFGLVLKAKGYKYKKNVIAGFIMAVLLCIFGSIMFAI